MSLVTEIFWYYSIKEAQYKKANSLQTYFYLLCCFMSDCD